jgi:hypothetical protein
MSAPEKWFEFVWRDLDGAEILFEKGRYHLACYRGDKFRSRTLGATTTIRRHIITESC